MQSIIIEINMEETLLKSFSKLSVSKLKILKHLFSKLITFLLIILNNNNIKRKIRPTEPNINKL